MQEINLIKQRLKEVKILTTPSSSGTGHMIVKPSIAAMGR